MDKKDKWEKLGAIILLRREQKKRKIYKILKLGHEGFNFRFTGFDFRSSSFYLQLRQTYVVIALKGTCQWMERKKLVRLPAQL